MSDRPTPSSESEIEITPEMIEAGALVLAGFDTYFCSEEIWAERVYLAMRRAAALPARASRDQIAAARRKRG